MTDNIPGAGGGIVFINGRRVVKAFRSCVCRAVEGGGVYDLSCGIDGVADGGHTLLYFEKFGFIERADGLRLTLSEDAKETASGAIRAYRARAEEIERGAEKVSFEEIKLAFFIRRLSQTSFDAVMETESGSGAKGIYIFEAVPFSRIIKTVFSEESVRRDGLVSPGFKKRVCAAFSSLAEKTGDSDLLLLTRHYCDCASFEENGAVERLLGHKILPVLPEEFDRTYVVDADESFRPLLEDSNYVLSRVMILSPDHAFYEKYKDDFIHLTRSRWALNPHTRSGSDAAEKDGPSMPFSEYLKLFEKADKKV